MFFAVAQPLQAQDQREVQVLTFDGPVNPLLVSYLEQHIAQAENAHAAALVLRLDTPGGQVDLTQDIVKMIRSSSVPVIVYVWPSGGMAGSAGTFITLAAHAAAMTPGTSIGAASPVDASGADLGETMRKKLINIYSADIENLTKRRGEKAVEWARSSVIEAKAATAEQALELGVIDAVASDLDDLLRQLDGLQVEVNGQAQRLQLENAVIVDEPLTGVEGLLNTLVNAIAIPGIAILLIVLGVQAILGEVSQPGGYLAGIVGAVALLLGLFALGILNANWVGLAFIALSFVLFLVDIKAPTHGVLTAGAIVSLILGGIVLFSGTEVAIPWATIIGVASFSALFFTFVIAKAVRAQRRKPFGGPEGLIGQQAIVRTPLEPFGTILVQGELWEAVLQGEPHALPPGGQVTVIGRDGLKLLVRPAP